MYCQRPFKVYIAYLQTPRDASEYIYSILIPEVSIWMYGAKISAWNLVMRAMRPPYLGYNTAPAHLVR